MEFYKRELSEMIVEYSFLSHSFYTVQLRWNGIMPCDSVVERSCVRYEVSPVTNDWTKRCPFCRLVQFNKIRGRSIFSKIINFVDS